MQVSGTTSNSAAWALRQLFQQQSPSGQQTSGAGQSLPSASPGPSPAAAALSGMNGPQMSQGTMSGFMSLQAQAPVAPSASDMATQMMSSLDANGDGVVSLAEAEAGGGANAAQAFQMLDGNGDGSLSSDEITNAVQQAGQHHHGHHHHAKGAGSSGDAANALMQALDTDGQAGLSLDEVTAAVGGDASSDAISRGFSALDTNGDGALSASELTSAINSYMQTRNAQNAAAVSAGATI